MSSKFWKTLVCIFTVIAGLWIGLLLILMGMYSGFDDPGLEDSTGAYVYGVIVILLGFIPVWYFAFNPKKK